MAPLQQVKNRNKIHILNILEESRWGGPQTRIFRLSKELNKSIFVPFTIFPKKNSEKISYMFDSNGLEYERINLTPIKSKLLKMIKYLFYFIPEIIIIKKTASIIKPHIIQCNGASQIKGLIVAKLLKIPTVWFLNDTRTPNIVKLLFQFLIRVTNPNIIANSTRVKEYYLGKNRNSRKSIRIIQSPVDDKYFSLNNISNSDVSKIDKITRVVTVANINPDKGLEYFIGMIPLLNKNNKNVQFFIAGSYLESQKVYYDKLNAKIKKLNINNINFMGHLDDITPFLKSGDIYVCSSISEASPISVWEAMAIGLPIVSTDVGDVKKFLKNEKYNFISHLKNSQDLAKKTNELIMNKMLQKEYGNYGRTIAKKYLTVQICAKMHEELYNKIIRENYKNDNFRN